MTNPTTYQSSLFESIRRALPAGTTFDADTWAGGEVLVRFAYDDPRPSRNLLVDAGLRGHVVIGKRGGVLGYYVARMEPFADSAEGNRTKAADFLWTLRLQVKLSSHRFMR